MLRLRVTHGASLSPLLPVLVSALPAVLAALALLTLPSAPDALRDLDVIPGVEVVLATRGAVQQVTQLARAQLGNLEKITINTLLCMSQDRGSIGARPKYGISSPCKSVFDWLS